MKLIQPSSLSQLSGVLDTLTDLWAEARRQRFPLWILLGLGLNLAIAPAVLAATHNTFERGTAYAIGLLLIVTIALAIYLFAVILQPERF